MQYHLSPKTNWNHFSQHKALIDKIFAKLIPLVNQKRLHYINPTSEISIFEDLNGNYIYLSFPKDKITELIISLENTNEFTEETLNQTLRYIETTYDLEKIPIDD